MSCAVCSKTAIALRCRKLKKCAGCRTVRYCSRTCQTIDWPVHRRVCVIPELQDCDTDLEKEDNTNHSCLEHLEARLSHVETRIERLARVLEGSPEQTYQKPPKRRNRTVHRPRERTPLLTLPTATTTVPSPPAHVDKDNPPSP